MRKHPDVVALVLALLLIVGSALTIVQPANAVSQSDIDALKTDASALSTQKKELQQKIDALSDDISSNLEKKQLLDSQIAVLEEEISNAEEQIAAYGTMIAQSEEQLAETEALEEAQYELFCQRVRAMEEQGTTSYWNVLFKATSFSDMLSRLDVVNEIMEADQRVIGQFCQLKMDMLHLGRCAITGYLFMLPEDSYKHDVGHDICSIHLFHQLIANRCGTVLMPYGRIASEKLWVPINI